MSGPEPAPGEMAGAALLQRSGEEIAAIVLEMISASADREGGPVSREHFSEGIGLLLASAWTFARLADANEDGGRGRRYHGMGLT